MITINNVADGKDRPDRSLLAVDAVNVKISKANFHRINSYLPNRV